MEIDLYRDDGIVHVITPSVSHLDKTMWVATYFGNCRYDGRNWRGYYAHETGFPSDFTNFVKGRSANEAWFGTDKGVGVVADFPSDTTVSYTRDPKTLRGRAVVYREGKPLRVFDMDKGIPHNYILGLDIDGNDVWVATSKGLGWGIGKGYYAGLKPAGPDVGQPVGASTPAPPGTARPPVRQGYVKEAFPFEVSEETLHILRKINGLNPYEGPDLKLKNDPEYAHIPQNLYPFSGYGDVKPFKKFFLEQLEYTGPGRAIPEPAEVKTVKIGFIGPIYPTVSVATGGKSHEEVLGTKMRQGAELAIEQANARGGYWRRRVPFELVKHNDNGLWGAWGTKSSTWPTRTRSGRSWAPSIPRTVTSPSGWL